MHLATLIFWALERQFEFHESICRDIGSAEDSTNNSNRAGAWLGGAGDRRSCGPFRDLLLILAMRDIKLRYKQTALGVIWVVLQPLIAALIFAVIFGRLAPPAVGRRALPAVRLCRAAAVEPVRRGAPTRRQQPRRRPRV